ncbi:uncharacterized protein LOC110618026 isoform X2 [Manihot esculenta]|uniref:Uncharacterized protein n=1 Tax=Manihot esculenta TaxID=3983 RepID=A0ACB7HI53_MANES|nr:uncharacterized protein LOC110618026 isoform X2 [Manihot esculenta]KAG8652459.1 hypothetical protein MANES_06G094000v8 [Manihot esculenta]
MEMAKVVRNWWSHSKTVVLIWSICIAIYFSLLRLALNNSSSLGYTSTIDSPVSNMEQRSRLYDKMERDLDENGPAFLKHGGTTQSLSLSDIFTLKDGSVKPVHKAANPPVRANVLYLSPEYSVPISESAKQVFHPYFGKAIWFQNSSLYHFSMFHASHHIVPVPATEDEIEAEATAVGAVAEGLCPLKIVLDRVVLTSTGVLLGCWQYDDAILHTSFARLLGHPKVSSTEPSKELHVSHELVARLNSIIRGAEVVISELWYVEEYDVLALALDGRMKERRFRLGCKRT